MTRVPAPATHTVGSLTITATTGRLTLSGSVDLKVDQKGRRTTHLLVDALCALHPQSEQPAPAHPLDNSSFPVGGLTVESASDGVSLYGEATFANIGATADQAAQLLNYLSTLATYLDGLSARNNLPDEEAVVAPVQRANPFG